MLVYFSASMAVHVLEGKEESDHLLYLKEKNKASQFNSNWIKKLGFFSTPWQLFISSFKQK